MSPLSSSVSAPPGRSKEAGRNQLGLLLSLAMALTVMYAIGPAEAKKLFPPEPAAVEAAPDILVTPPGEEAYFPVRPDGQPFLLNIDTTVNLTDKLSDFYYDPKFRGEVWAPFDQVNLIERATRLMSTWQDYDQFSTYRKLNNVNKFFEKYSGFGP